MGKTNIDIVDQDLWNWVKSQKNKFNLRSVSDYIFKILNEYREMNIEKSIFLINIEKYFEYSYFDFKEMSYNLGLNAEQIIKLIDKYLGSDIPLFNIKDDELKAKILKKIHKLMIKNRILPRELSIAYNLRELVEKNHINISNYERDRIDLSEFENLNMEKILSILFSDPEERRREIYGETIRYAEKLAQAEKSKKIKCLDCKENCIIKTPDYLYYRTGIDISLSDLEDDLVSDILKESFKEKYLVCYGLCLAMAIDSIIKRNLLLVRDFIESELYLFNKSKDIIVLIEILIRISEKEAKSFIKEQEYFEEIYNQLFTSTIES